MENNLKITIGYNDYGEKISVPEKGLYQNFLITGTIGSGKTSSAMYPITQQLIEYNCGNNSKKIGMLVLDVKGNYYKKVQEYAKKYNRLNDIVVIELGGKYKYNPLDKPNVKASVLANRLKIILELFSGNTSESYWIDKSEEIICECIKLCRLYNDNYVSFEELHKLITNKKYYEEKIKIIKNYFKNNKYNQEQCYDLLSSINFFEKEFYSLDARSIAILKSQITRITNCFNSDYQVMKTFNPQKNESNFSGLKDIIKDGKIVILNMNIAEYKNLSKIIATYLKLDFQSEVMARLSDESDNGRIVAFISDEYHEYITETDADFYGQSREAKCINIVATQSYKSMLKTLNNETALSVVLQNLINKIWFRTDDIFTIEEAQKQIGKEEKEKITTSISENAKETKYSYITKSFKSKDSNISESINSSYEKDFIYDTKFFTQELETFTALAFLSDGSKALKPQKIKLIPWFMKESDVK
ncbi:MAG: type IV secretion system DNA-binding domain-containing protein [Bacilli bacterium]|nr:type IV secretion system DNA-binding domain-containing protein [Bacilli bacterium]